MYKLSDFRVAITNPVAAPGLLGSAPIRKPQAVPAVVAAAPALASVVVLVVAAAAAGSFGQRPTPKAYGRRHALTAGFTSGCPNNPPPPPPPPNMDWPAGLFRDENMVVAEFGRR